MLGIMGPQNCYLVIGGVKEATGIKVCVFSLSLIYVDHNLHLFYLVRQGGVSQFPPSFIHTFAFVSG